MKAPPNPQQLSDTEALERALDLLDFYAQLQKASGIPAQEAYPDAKWIELKMKNKS